MEPIFAYTTHDKTARYEQFMRDFLPYIADEHEEVSVLANTAAALRQAFGTTGKEEFGELYFSDRTGKELPLGTFFRFNRAKK